MYVDYRGPGRGVANPASRRKKTPYPASRRKKRPIPHPAPKIWPIPHPAKNCFLIFFISDISVQEVVQAAINFWASCALSTLGWMGHFGRCSWYDLKGKDINTMKINALPMTTFVSHLNVLYTLSA